MQIEVTDWGQTGRHNQKKKSPTIQITRSSMNHLVQKEQRHRYPRSPNTKQSRLSIYKHRPAFIKADSVFEHKPIDIMTCQFQPDGSGLCDRLLGEEGILLTMFSSFLSWFTVSLQEAFLANQFDLVLKIPFFVRHIYVIYTVSGTTVKNKVKDFSFPVLFCCA